MYIGQAGARKNGEGILNRLQEHKRNPEKDYWTEAIVFTTSNNSLGPTEISYLENRFCNLALEANRYDVKNSNDPTLGSITEEKENEMEEFIDYAKVIVGVLGHKLFEPMRKAAVKKADVNTPPMPEDTVKLHLERTVKNVGRVEADGAQTAEGFVVFKGSRISPIDDDISDLVKKRRKRARVNKKVNEQGMLLEDMLFSSPTAAAEFVIGKKTNGLTYWITASGQTLKDLISHGIA